MTDERVRDIVTEEIFRDKRKDLAEAIQVFLGLVVMTIICYCLYYHLPDGKLAYMFAGQASGLLVVLILIGPGLYRLTKDVKEYGDGNN